MIGYYAHHRGAGHLHRAMSIAHELDDDVTILSSSPRPHGWTGGWVDLPLDHSPHDRDPAADASANGALHWAPLGSAGLRDRTSAITDWLRVAQPSAVVVDVSVEIALLVRLHGIPVVSIAQPGHRSDAPHTLGYRASSAIIAVWPPGVDALTVDDTVVPHIENVGAISLIATVAPLPRVRDRIAVLAGFGTRGLSALDAAVADARRALPDAEWVILSGADADAVAQALRTSALVFAHCGENALAEIAASRVPAVLVPEARPHDEQHAMGRALARSGMPVTVVGARGGDGAGAGASGGDGEGSVAIDWPELVRATAVLDGDGWNAWCDGGAAVRAARIVARVAESLPGGSGIGGSGIGGSGISGSGIGTDPSAASARPPRIDAA